MRRLTMNLKKIIAMGISLVVAAALAAGQNAPLQERLKMRENVITLRLLRLTQALDLTEAQAAKIYPTFNRVEKEKLEIQKTMSADIASLRRLLKEPGTKDEELAARLGSVKAAQNAMKAKDAELDAFLEANLTTVQRARYLLFQIEFYRGLADVLERVGMRRGQAGAVPPAPIKK
jgi:Spy/CpxP family protein refolding chaperone